MTEVTTVGNIPGFSFGHRDLRGLSDRRTDPTVADAFSASMPSSRKAPATSMSSLVG